MSLQEPSLAEERENTYKNAMDSVYLIGEGQRADESEEDWIAAVKRNVEHLEIMVAKEDFWVDEDLSPFHVAIESGKSIIG